MPYIKIPFAQGGDRTPVPMDDPGDGSLSFQTGYGPLFSENPETSTTANRIGRDNYNGVEFRITFEIQQYQRFSNPNFITSAENNGVSFPYSISSRVRYDPGTGVRVYESLVNSNTELPTVAANWFDVSTVLVSGDAISTLSVGLGLGVSGTGTTRNVTLNIDGITTNSTIAENHFLPFSSGVDNRKTTISNFIATFITKALIDPLRVDAQTLGGNQASAFVGSARRVSTNTNSGLLGGGDLSVDREIELDIFNLQQFNSTPATEIATTRGLNATRKTSLSEAVSSVVNTGFINSLSGINAATVGGAVLSTLARTSTRVTGINGLSGGGDLSGNRTITLSIENLSSAIPGGTDLFVFTDRTISSSTHRTAEIFSLLSLDQPGKTFTSAVTVQGRMTANLVRSLSDERLKNHIEDLDPQHSLESVIQWKKVLAEYNDEAKKYVGQESEGPQVCLYAQDVEKTHPQMTSNLSKDSDYRTVAYDRVSVVLASAVEALSDQLSESNRRIDELERLVNL